MSGWSSGQVDDRSVGVTEIIDLEMSDNISAWRRRSANGFKTLRVQAGVYPDHLHAAIGKRYKTGDVLEGTNGLVTVGPYKIITDGSLGSRTAYCHAPYPGTDDHGIFVYPSPTLESMVRKGVEAGYRLAVHAIGDKANHLTLETMQKVASEAPLPLNSSIEHAQLLDPSDIPLFAKLGLVASIQPLHLIDDVELCHAFWPTVEQHAYAFKSLVDAHIPVRLGSDCPIAALDPWGGMAAAIERSDGKQAAFYPDQCIDLQTAYAASTCVSPLFLVKGSRSDRETEYPRGRPSGLVYPPVRPSDARCGRLARYVG